MLACLVLSAQVALMTPDLTCRVRDRRGALLRSVARRAMFLRMIGFHDGKAALRQAGTLVRRDESDEPDRQRDQAKALVNEEEGMSAGPLVLAREHVRVAQKEALQGLPGNAELSGARLGGIR